MAKTTQGVGSALEFLYRVRNGPASPKPIFSFAVEFGSEYSATKAPNGWEGGRFKTKDAFRWMEVTGDDSRNISPGGVADGFGLVAAALPGIIHSWIQGQNEGVVCDNDEFSDDPEVRRLSSFFNDSVQGKTVGPTAPPKVFDPVKYTEYILDLKNQAVQLGWIKDAAVSDELGGKLSAISGQLSAIQDQMIPVTTGRQVLELAAQFMQYVEANSCKEFDCPVPEGATPKPLTSEAYALMYFNMDYFATQVAKACNVPPPVIEPSPKRQPSTADRPAPKPSKK